MNTYKRILFLFLIFTAINTSAQSKAHRLSTSKNNSTFTYAIIDGAEKTFGYNIYVDGRLKIHQPFIPGVQGIYGFKTKHDAEKVAKLAIRKMRQGQIPPAITKEEMKKLKVL